MNDTPPATNSDTPARKPRRPWWMSLLILVAIVGYLLAKPKLEEWLGTELPGGNLTAQEPSAPEQLPQKNSTQKNSPSAGQSKRVRIPVQEGSRTVTQESKRVDKKSASPSVESKSGQASQPTANESGQPELGELKKVSSNVWVSTAGLRYGPGSREGHRLKHVMLHSRDEPDRAGKHGVFDGDEAEILALLDEVYLTAQKRGPPGNVRIEREDDRTIYTVNLNRRIGFMGGEVGKSRGRPALKSVRIVLEGNSVITAFPSD